MKYASKPLRSVADLAEAGLAPAGDAHALEQVAARYAVAVTADMVQLIDRSDPADPIARQFVPDTRELQHLPEERADPLGEARLSPVPGLVHRYPDRVLLKLTHVCPVYCRFCFRREVVGPGGPPALSGEGARCGARLHRRRARHLGGDPDRRRPVHALPAPHRRGHAAARRHRPPQGAALAHARARGGPVSRHAGAGRGAQVGQQDGLRGAARQPPARAD